MMSSKLHPEFLNALLLLKVNNWSVEELYHNWWSGLPTEGQFPAVKNVLHPPVKSRRVSRQEDYEIHTLGYKAVSLFSGEFINIDEESSLIIRRSSWSSKWWNWRQTRTPNQYPSGKILRLYLPTFGTNFETLTSSMMKAFDDNFISATLKFRRQNGVFRDNLVIWLDERQLYIALPLVQELLENLVPSAEPPPLTKHFGNIGIAEHPTSGQSLGWMFSEIVWTSSKSNYYESLDYELGIHGISPTHPWIIGENDRGRNWTESS